MQDNGVDTENTEIIQESKESSLTALAFCLIRHIPYKLKRKYATCHRGKCEGDGRGGQKFAVM